MKPTGGPEISALHARFSERSNAIRARLSEFAMIPPSEYFYELCYCLLTPQSSARHAARAVEALKRADFLAGEIDPLPILADKNSYIRFHNTKARRLIEAKEAFPVIRSAIETARTGKEARIWLVENVRGIGWKEASHFLRNIGYTDLAILDRHILRNLKNLGVIGRYPVTLTKKRYLSIESRFRRFADRSGITLDELDLLFWSDETGEILK